MSYPQDWQKYRDAEAVKRAAEAAKLALIEPADTHTIHSRHTATRVAALTGGRNR